jgi:hypothetical protein
MALLQKAYLGATPLFRNTSFFEDDGAVPIDESSAVTVTANASAHTKGSWTELIASASANASWLILVVQNINTTTVDTNTLLDVGTGASGSEAAAISNIAVGGAITSGVNGIVIPIPIKIDSGTRIAARIQSVVTGGKTAGITAFLFDAGDHAVAPTSFDVIGTDAATSAGTAYSGASGTYVQAIASTSNKYRGVIFVPSTNSATVGGITINARIATGASGAEQDFATSRAGYQNNEAVFNVPPYLTLFGKNIPAGSRLSVKHDIAATPDRYGFCLIGIR